MVFDQQRRRHFLITEFAGVQVQHEACDGAFQTGQMLLQHDEARTGEFGCGLEIHLTQRFTEIEMFLGFEVQRPRCAEAMTFDIVVFILADRGVVERNIRDRREFGFQFSGNLAFILFGRLQRAFERRHFVHQLLGERVVLLGLGRADLL